MISPLWAFFGLMAALLSSGMMLSQEKLRVNGYALAFWVKVVSAFVTLPFVIYHGIPDDPLFYLYLFATAVIYAVSDVIFFSGINKTDAGAVARLVPSAAVFSFLIWFIIQPSLFFEYVEQPVIALAIFGVLCAFAFFAFRLKHCAVTVKTIKAIWFVIVAATIGPLFTKLTIFHAEREIAVYSYVFFQAIMMLGLWVVFLILRKPIQTSLLLSHDTIVKSIVVGIFSAAMVLVKFLAFYFVDNPAYIPAIIAMDTVIILFIHKMWGKKTEANLKAGMALVFCAALLIILKAQM